MQNLLPRLRQRNLQSSSIVVNPAEGLLQKAFLAVWGESQLRHIDMPPFFCPSPDGRSAALPGLVRAKIPRCRPSEVLLSLLFVSCTACILPLLSVLLAADCIFPCVSVILFSSSFCGLILCFLCEFSVLLIYYE